MTNHHRTAQERRRLKNRPLVLLRAIAALPGDDVRARSHMSLPVRLAGVLLLGVTLLAGCQSKAPVPTPTTEAPTRYWSLSKRVDTLDRMVTLFDPFDLAHHQVDPADWYRYDYGFSDDLASGRFAAVMTDRNGPFRVRITESPLTQQEQAVAGPRAILRLRVRNHRLLLAGGDAWPSEQRRAADLAYDKRWVSVPNGDYRVIITVLDAQALPLHDLVFQLQRVESIAEVSHAPGIPQLIVGQPAAVAGINAPGFRYREDCSGVAAEAEWAPLSERQLPLPGAMHSVNIPERLYHQGVALTERAVHPSLPIVIARSTDPGSIGVYIEPVNWSEAVANNGQRRIRTRILCAVRIQSVLAGFDTLHLRISPLNTAFDQLPADLRHELVNRFGTWIRVSNDAAWSFKSAQARRATDDRSLVFGIMQTMDLGITETAELLEISNYERANRLLLRMPSQL